MNSCIGVCKKFKAVRAVGKGRYAEGQKRCTRCDVFMWTNGLYCPCCTRKLKTTPKNSKHKRNIVRIEN